MSSPALQPGAHPNLPQRLLARPPHTGTAPRCPCTMSHSLRTHGQLSSARPLASMAVAGRAPAPCRFVRQRLERPPHPRQQPGSMPLVASMCSAQGTHRNTLAAPPCRVKHMSRRTHLLRGSEHPHARGRSTRAHPAAHRCAAAPRTPRCQRRSAQPHTQSTAACRPRRTAPPGRTRGPLRSVW